MERRGEAVILELIDRPEVILRGGDDVANRKVGIAVLREGGAAVIRAARSLAESGVKGEESLPSVL